MIQHVDSACTKRTTLCETCYMWSGPLNQGIQHAHKHDMLSCYPLPRGDLTNHCLYAACTHHMVFSTCGYYVTNRHVYMFNFISYTPFPWNYITHTLQREYYVGQDKNYSICVQMTCSEKLKFKSNELFPPYLFSPSPSPFLSLPLSLSLSLPRPSSPYPLIL